MNQGRFTLKVYEIESGLTILLSIILAIEFASLMLYAGGGRTLNHVLLKKGNVTIINYIAGTLMIGVVIWLMLV